MEEENLFQKTQTVDPEVRAYVYSLVNALGGTSADEAGRYLLGDDALACLRDLKRWLKLYDEKTNRLDVARCLAEANLVTGDLLPILASWPESTNDKLKARVALACLELLVPLTWPLEIDRETTLNQHRHTPYIQQSQILAKAGILGWDTCSILRQVVRIGLPSIAMAREYRTNRDEGIIKLVLYFLRNITVIRQIPNLPTQGLENEVSRSATIEAFRQQDVFALLLTICSNMGEDFNLEDVIVLDILFNLIKGVEVKKLWMTEDQRKGYDFSELRDALKAEKGMHRDHRKAAPSRHGRFGTMIWVKREEDKMSAVSGQENLKDGRTTLFNMDKSKKWTKPQQKRKDMNHTMNDFDHSTRLTDAANDLIRNFVEEFLDSGFNPLFTHLRRAIEREAERLLDINYRQFFYTVSWFLEAERLRREKQMKVHEHKKIATDFEVESYGLVAAVLNQETFITLNRYMQMSFENREWQDLNAGMRCFTQILLTVQEMAQSPLEDDQEIADNIQNRIFYEETTHDRIIAILKGYKDQGFGYLDACTELSYVFLRLLERYSKENVDLQIRSKKRARKKRKEERQQQAIADGGSTNQNDPDDPDEQSEDEVVADVVQVSKERKFDFTRFAAKFTSQSSVDTYLAFTTFYRDLSVDQLKRAHRFFYRVAFKQELWVLLHRVDMIALFYKLIKGPEGLDVSHSMYKDWSELTRQLFKRMFKKLNERPELMVEMLFSKINVTTYFLEHGHEKQTATTTRAPAELEVRPAPGRDATESVGIVVAAMMNDHKEKFIKWVKGQIKRAEEERRGWEDEAQSRKANDDADAEREGEQRSTHIREAKPSYFTVRPMDEEIRIAMLRDARLRLLMRLVGFEKQEDEDVHGSSWIVPSSLTADQLEEMKKTIEQFERTPWMPEHEDDTVEGLLRRARNREPRDGDEKVRRDAFIDDSEGEDRIENIDFADNIRPKSPSAKDTMEKLKKIRQKRNHEAQPSDDEAEDARRHAREHAALDRRRKIKSDLYIRDSDDEMDGEERREFFKREEEGRKRREERIRKAIILGIDEERQRERKRKSADEIRERTKKRKMVKSENEGLFSDDDDTSPSQEGQDTASSQQQEANTEEESGTEETPLSSQDTSQISGIVQMQTGLKELRKLILASSNATKTLGGEVGDEEDRDDGDDDEDEAPIVSTARRRVRAGFLVDSDDDDE